MNFMPWTDSGAFDAMPRASPATVASSSAPGTTRFTSPMRNASAALIRSPLNSIIRACA